MKHYYLTQQIYNHFLQKKYLNPQSLTIASSTVLMIKATQEGSRQILIVASRKREIMVRDAFTGLLLRTMCSEQSPTIYSLYLDRGSVYCGTSDKGIIIVEFNVSVYIFYILLQCCKYCLFRRGLKLACITQEKAWFVWWSTNSFCLPVAMTGLFIFTTLRCKNMSPPSLDLGRAWSSPWSSIREW